jgi:hypothetical protein
MGMFSGYLNQLVAREHTMDLRETARRRAWADAGATPVTRVTLRYGADADAERLRAPLPLDGSGPIADPFHRGAELLELLALRATQLGRQPRSERSY